MLLEPFVAAWTPLYQMRLLLSLILLQIASAVVELVTVTKQLARDKSQQEPPAKRNASHWAVVSRAFKPPFLSAAEALVGSREGTQ